MGREGQREVLPEVWLLDLRHRKGLAMGGSWGLRDQVPPGAGGGVGACVVGSTERERRGWLRLRGADTEIIISRGFICKWHFKMLKISSEGGGKEQVVSFNRVDLEGVVGLRGEGRRRGKRGDGRMDRWMVGCSVSLGTAEPETGRRLRVSPREGYAGPQTSMSDCSNTIQSPAGSATGDRS